jgi:hypothetical protein
MPTILYKLASRSRKEKCFACIENIIEQSTIDDYLILLSFDVDDPEMTGDDVKQRLATYGDKVKAYWGISGSKVIALNRDICFAPEWQYLVVTSDDFWIDKNGFDQDVINDFSGFSGLLHYPDGHANARLVTMPIMDREYYQIDNFVYNPIYFSVFADNEQMAVAQKRGRYKFVNERKVTHRHPIWGWGAPDAQLRHTESFYEVDRPTFIRRQQENFGL